MIRLLLFFWIGSTTMTSGFGQVSLNYLPKSLQKELKHAGILDFSTLTEIENSELSNMSDGKNGKYFEVNQANQNGYAFIYIGRVESCRAGGCALSLKDEVGSFEYFDYFVIFDASKNVRYVKVFNYQATHGHEIAAKGWLKQFYDYDGSYDLEVNKNIDAISGATISAKAITSDISDKTRRLKEFIDIKF